MHGTGLEAQGLSNVAILDPQVAQSAGMQKSDIPFTHKQIEELEKLGKATANIASQQDAVIGAIQKQLRTASDSFSPEVKEAMNFPMIVKALDSLTYSSRHQMDLGLKVASNMIRRRRDYYLVNSNTERYIIPQLMAQPILAPHLFNGAVGTAQTMSVRAKRDWHYKFQHKARARSSSTGRQGHFPSGPASGSQPSSRPSTPQPSQGGGFGGGGPKGRGRGKIFSRPATSHQPRGRAGDRGGSHKKGPSRSS